MDAGGPLREAKIGRVQIERRDAIAMLGERHAVPPLTSAEIKHARTRRKFQQAFSEGYLLRGTFCRENMAINIQVIVAKKFTYQALSWDAIMVFELMSQEDYAAI